MTGNQTTDGETGQTEYKRYRVLWPDHLGLARGKYLPRRTAGKGTSFCLGVYLQGYDKGIYEVETGVDPTGFPDLEAEFDLATARPCWESDTGVVIADLSFQHQPFAASARHTLRRAIADWEAVGYTPKVGIELEAYVLESDGAGGWQPFETPAAYVYGTGSLMDPTGLVVDIMDRAEAAGIPVESLNTEFDSPQFELTLEYGDALESIDNVFLFKELAREVAGEHGLKLTFLGRPLADRAGSGLHVNLSLADRSGVNALFDSERPDGLTELADRCIAGLIAHHEGLTAICAPTVTAYRRLVPGELVGQWANWGFDHRCAAVRVPPQRGDATRIEHRMADGAANPYITTAAVLQAARLGVVGDLPRPDPETGDGMDSINTDRRCAANLGDAIKELVADRELTDAIGADVVANFVGIKQIEWDSFIAAEPNGLDPSGPLSDWERATYLPFH
ncbi:MAG: glutamine synthetase family protein [Acidimicrobiales bacterium]